MFWHTRFGPLLWDISGYVILKCTSRLGRPGANTEEALAHRAKLPETVWTRCWRCTVARAANDAWHPEPASCQRTYSLGA